MAALPSFYLNLEESRYRREMMETMVVPILPNIERIPAVDGRSAVDVETDPRLSVAAKAALRVGRRRLIDEFPGLGAVGCSLSHIRVWRRIVADGSPLAIVLEDDTRIGRVAPEVARQMKALAALQVVRGAAAGTGAAPDDRQCVTGGVEGVFGANDSVPTLWMLRTTSVNEHGGVPFYADGCVPESDIILEGGSWVQLKHFLFTAGYILNQAAAQVLLDNAFPLEVQVDHYMAALTRLGMLNVVAVPRRVNMGLVATQAKTTVQTGAVADLINGIASALGVP